MSQLYTLADLEQLMARLRDPVDGCPWDLKQTWNTIVPHTLEEVYEVVEAIENEDFTHVREELGDLLFQIIFYCQFAREQERFQLQDVIHDIVVKLLRRHPHVFPEGTLESRRDPNQTPQEADIKNTWEAIKKREKGESVESLLAGVPVTLPALKRAEKIQKKAARVGFDWPEVEPVVDNLKFEITELQDVMASDNIEAMEDELGDILFSAVNLARHLKISPDQALRKSVRKFQSRFEMMEQICNKKDLDFASLTLEEKDDLWRQAKKLTQGSVESS